MKIISALFLGLLCLTAASSYAQGDRPAPPSFSEMDTNGDGVLTTDEIDNNRLLEMFDTFDQDGSGSLSEDELPEPGEHPDHPPR